MDKKSFSSGFIVGGICVAVLWALLPGREPGSRNDLEALPVTAGPAPADFTPAQPDAAEPSESEPSGSPPPSPVSSTSEPLQDQDVQQPAPRLNWIELRRAALAAEPRDDSWSYFTEQAMQQFLAQHADISGFSIDFIECRSTICQIGVEGFDESTGPTWQRILLDLRQQLWYNFGQVGSSSGEVDGRFKLITEFHRGDDG